MEITIWISGVGPTTAYFETAEEAASWATSSGNVIDGFFINGVQVSAPFYEEQAYQLCLAANEEQSS